MLPGVRPSMFFASRPDRLDRAAAATGLHGCATTDGSLSNDAAATDIDERVGRAEIDGKVVGEISERRFLNMSWRVAPAGAE